MMQGCVIDQRINATEPIYVFEAVSSAYLGETRIQNYGSPKSRLTFEYDNKGANGSRGNGDMYHRLPPAGGPKRACKADSVR